MELAEKAGLSPTAISLIETAGRKSAELTSIIDIANALEVPLAKLVDGVESRVGQPLGDVFDDEQS